MLGPVFPLPQEESVSQDAVPETLTQCRCHYNPPVKEHIHCPDFGKSDGTNLLPEGTVCTFATFQLKYADIRFSDKHDYPDDPDVHYRMFWFHTFQSEDALSAYLNEWSTETGITFE